MGVFIKVYQGWNGLDKKHIISVKPLTTVPVIFLKSDAYKSAHNQNFIQVS